MKYHQKKTLILKILDVLPRKIGYAIYHYLQKRTFKNIEPLIESNRNSLQKIKSILSKINVDLKGKKVIEIGSGWMPIMPFLMKSEFDVSKIITYDINRHYSNERIEKMYNHFKDEVYNTRAFAKLDLPDFIDYYPETNIIDAVIDRDVSLIYSRFVLEHVTPSDMEKMHKKFYREMHDKVQILHLISPSDHRGYSDSTLSIYDFLKYSEDEWNRIQTKFDYHNRLRLPEYLEIFKRSGFDISYSEFDKVDKNSEKYRKFKELNLHPDYQKFSEEEILAGSICVLLTKNKSKKI